MAITPPQDRTITQQVQDNIAGRGLDGACRIAVDTSKGQVTLSGSVQNARQKTVAVQAARGIAGVRTVFDRLIVKAVPKY